MPIDLNNVKSPHYSKIEREFESSLDWTINDTNTLVLFVRGKLTNPATPLYVAIQDTSNHAA